ncbi:MAG: tyrosine-type recombinase/integrase [Bacteroides sp.]|nr:tyrosine-type recombinase/integrase [Bacteroides sp.]
MTEIESFISHITDELGYSACTVEAYRDDLARWERFAVGNTGETFRPLDVTRNDLRLWVADMAARRLSARTIRRRIAAVRALYRYLMRRGDISSSPAAGLTLPKPSVSLPVNIRPEETGAILDNPVPADSFSDVRDRLILDILYTTGMRCSELIGLKDADVDTRKGELKVLGKRNKERVIPFGPELAASIDAYRDLRDSSPDTEVSVRDTEAPLMVRNNGEPLYRKMVYNVVHRMLAEGGAHASRLSPHVMRHSMATDMLNDGAPLSTVQQLLGHASLTSTQVYTHVTYRDLKHNYQLAHPRAQNNKGGHYGH